MEESFYDVCTKTLLLVKSKHTYWEGVEKSYDDVLKLYRLLSQNTHTLEEGGEESYYDAYTKTLPFVKSKHTIPTLETRIVLI